MDFLLYLREDYSCRADRVDAFLTVLWHPNEDHLIGIKLKGFRFLFQQLKLLLELKEDAIFPLVKALEIALVGGVAEHIINAVERERLEDLYGKARELVADISVSPEEWMRAAA